MIKMQGLTKKFDSLVAVDQVTLEVQPGEVLALLGPNGAGKTTTVRMLSAILRPTAGRAEVAGFDVVTQAQEVRQRVGVLTEAPGLYTRMSGYEYLDFFGQMRGMSLSDRQTRIEQLARWFKMDDVLGRRLGQYSKGMAQKIALIRTLLHDPAVLLLDEPTSAMDPQSARLVRDGIHQMRSDRRSVIICTHNLPEAEELADRIAIIRQGQIVAQGTIAELKAQLLGPPLMEVRFAKAPQNGVRALVEQYATVEEVTPWTIRYRAPEPAQINPMLLRRLLEQDYAVLTLGEVAQSLEAIYLRVVGATE
mgnify:CR=1 FL=1